MRQATSNVHLSQITSFYLQSGDAGLWVNICIFEVADIYRDPSRIQGEPRLMMT